MLHALGSRDRHALRLLPPLLHCSFRHPGLSDPAPGIAGLRSGRRWGEAARRFGLPSPHTAQLGKRLVQAVWLVPASDGLEVRVVHSPNAIASERRHLERRLAVAAGLLAHQRLRLRLCDGIDGAVLLFGGLLAGEAVQPDGPAIAPAMLAERAPTSLAAFLLSLVRRADPLRVFLAWTAALPAFWLADAELFAALWARFDDVAAELPLEAAAVGGSSSSTRRFATRLLPAKPRGAVEVGRALCFAVARQRHRLIPALVGELRNDMLVTGMPAALLPALQREIAAAGAGVLGARRPGGGRAMLRHLALCARVGLIPEQDPFWLQVARRLGHAGSDAAIATIGSIEEAGPPFDPLNRGPGAKLCLAPGRVVRMERGRSGTPRHLPAPELLAALLRAAAAGTPCDLLGDGPAAAPLVGRLDRLLRRCREARHPLALEAGGAVLLLREGALRRFSRERFLSRPRACAVDDEAPLLAAVSAASAHHAVECTVVAAQGGETAWVIYGSEGRRFGEKVRVARLEAHLQESRALLEGAAALLVRHAGARLPLLPADAATATVPLALGGDLRDGLWLEILGERFGAGARWRWEAAASAIAAAWPVGTTAPLRFLRVAVRVGGRQAAPLERLYARSVASRRLWIHLHRILGP
ncbi:hypothetical protein [Vulgatibacter sp.]|uniref:hypothetical protein n=1 Tax=Vulgatibacter sp. TaxID=1971226 RepID=UPI0035667222